MRWSWTGRRRQRQRAWTTPRGRGAVECLGRGRRGRRRGCRRSTRARCRSWCSAGTPPPRSSATAPSKPTTARNYGRRGRSGGEGRPTPRSSGSSPTPTRPTAFSHSTRGRRGWPRPTDRWRSRSSSGSTSGGRRWGSRPTSSTRCAARTSTASLPLKPPSNSPRAVESRLGVVGRQGRTASQRSSVPPSSPSPPWHWHSLSGHWPVPRRRS
mmetsp:Transcript_29853/g.71762  ORF Transcript_29853/g.71762 Transcript_29853/m.71762 type:complete len:212 (-) Transcript_29853:52-687(-)